MIKRLLKKILPSQIFQWYHLLLIKLAVLIYRFPSEKLIVICVTGTNGKSTTVNLIAKTLEASGEKVGLTSTANFKIGNRTWLNKKKMTMLGRFGLQKILRKMVNAGCKYAVIEVSSEGIKQFRHLGINYDYIVFTNLTPEHIESHGSFEKYRQAKEELFSRINTLSKKKIDGRIIEKQIIVNLNDSEAHRFSNYDADKKWSYSIDGEAVNEHVKTKNNLMAEYVSSEATKTVFRIHGQTIGLKMIGKFNIYNALPGIIIGLEEKIELNKIREKLEEFDGLSGRMEFIYINQDFKVLVDYAPEPASLNKMYEAIKCIDYQRIIHILGSCGGGRDKARRPILGKIAGEHARIIIVTNEDPYDEDPQEIVDQVAQGVLDTGKILGKEVFKIIDRRKAIEMALEIAQTNDLVIITGKGSEQYIMGANGSKTPWDDRKVVRETLKAKN